MEFEMPFETGKILVSFDELSDVFARNAVILTNLVKAKNPTLGDFTFEMTAIYSANVTRQLFNEYKVKEEDDERTETSGS